MSGISNPGIILDLCIVAVLLWMIFRYIKRGFLSGIFDSIGTLLAIWVARWGANALSPALFEKLFRDNLVTRTANALANSEGVLTINEIINKISGFLPQNIIETFMDETNGSTFNTNVPGIAENIVTNVVQPLIIPVISILVFYLVFIVSRIIINFIVAALKNINKLPIIGAANRALGAASGLLVGLLYAYLIVSAVWALMVITGGDIPLLSQSTLDQSFFYSLFKELIPFS